MKTIITISVQALFSLALFGQSALPYYTGFNTGPEKVGWKQYRLGPAADPFYLWTTNNQLSHDYPVGGVMVTDDWMVSPEFDFTNGATIDSLRFKGAGFGTPFGIDTIALYLVSGYKNPDSSGTLTLLQLFTDSSYMNDNLWKVFNSIVIPPTSGQSHIAFRYKTDNNWLDISIDDIYIVGNPVGIGEQTNKIGLSVFPNPASDALQLNFENNLVITELTLVDIGGRIVKRFDKDNRYLDLSDVSGGQYMLIVEAGEEIHMERIVVE